MATEEDGAGAGPGRAAGVATDDLADAAFLTRTAVPV